MLERISRQVHAAKFTWPSPMFLHLDEVRQRAAIVFISLFVVYVYSQSFML